MAMILAPMQRQGLIGATVFPLYSRRTAVGDYFHRSDTVAAARSARAGPAVPRPQAPTRLCHSNNDFVQIAVGEVAGIAAIKMAARDYQLINRPDQRCARSN
jgi:hypothetical protein